jgi:squalene-hopene/tetraprenyl-beta-curcumene cyclase
MTRTAVLALACAAALAPAALLPTPVPARAEGGAAPAADPREAGRAAFDRGLAFLRGRAVEGKWGPAGKADPGVTAIVLTAFLERPGGLDPKDAALVDKALDWMLGLQKADGGIYDQGNGNYTTSLAIQALRLRGRPGDAAAVAKAAGYLKSLQFHDGEGAAKERTVAGGDVRYGGIGYGSDPTQPDLSNTQFALESLRAAGVPESDPAFQRALVYLRRTQNRRETETEGEPKELKTGEGKVVVRSGDGGAPYRPFDSKAGNQERPDGKLEARSYGSMTYALLKCYAYAGLPATEGAVADAVKWIRANYTWEENPGFTDRNLAKQGLFYYYATAAKALELLGDGAAGSDAAGKPRDWRGDLRGKILSLQKADGSWVNDVDRWMEGLPEIATAFALKALGGTVR